MSDWPVESHSKRVDRLLLMIAPFMVEGDEEGGEESVTPESWVAECWVSDLSSIGDFMLDEEQLANLSAQVGFEVKNEYLIYEVAKKMT